MRRASERIFGVVFERENMLSVSVRKYEERNIMKKLSVLAMTMALSMAAVGCAKAAVSEQESSSWSR